MQYKPVDDAARDCSLLQ